MVYRIYVEKKPQFARQSDETYRQLTELLQISKLTKVRIINRYDVENIDKTLFDNCVGSVFSQPQVDNTFANLDIDTPHFFAVEYHAGQFDQRADSAEQCIQLISQCERPKVKTAKVYLLYGNLSADDVKKIQDYCINPMECRLAQLDLPDTLSLSCTIPTSIDVVDGFCSLSTVQLADFISNYGLAMDIDDILFCQQYFSQTEKREPTITEIKLIDTYWSDHCRHTTFSTVIDEVTFDDAEIEQAYKLYVQTRAQLHRTKPITLMDIATLAAKKLVVDGKLDNLDESEEINACTVKIKVNVDGEQQDWLLLFKNETHNHPTEIEPFGGAATCIGGAIRDPLSGRAYVYSAMRVTGAGNPTEPLSATIKGKLPQRKIVTGAAEGYSSYGNQIGLATGLVEEIYHHGYTAKRMEIGAVVGAVPQSAVVRQTPSDGDKVIVIGGATGRDGCGGATGSSKSHNVDSISTCGAEVQKGNAPEERKLQRLFRNKNASLLIKRCNDFGAGGVSVAIGELADGLIIDLNALPKKYEGLDGTELAISESQERMAVVVAEKDAEKFISYAMAENLTATIVATVKKDKRLVMYWSGQKIVDCSREFLNSNGAQKHITASVSAMQNYQKPIPQFFEQGIKDLLSNLNVCDKSGLVERFDSTIGANTVLAPYGGKYQLTPTQALAHLVAQEKADTDTCSLLSYGFNPEISEKSPYHGAYLAVVESVCKLIACGATYSQIYLSFQEYFEKLGKAPQKWGKPLSALLGAFAAQLHYNVGAIGGKDSMSGSFENLHVPPTLVSFAVTVDNAQRIVSSEFKHANSKVLWLRPNYDSNGIPEIKSLQEIFAVISNLVDKGKVTAMRTLGYGGLAEAIFKMCIGNGYGVALQNSVTLTDLFAYNYGSFAVEVSSDFNEKTLPFATLIGVTGADYALLYQNERLTFADLLPIYQNKLSEVYPTTTKLPCQSIEKITSHRTTFTKFSLKACKPKVLIPVFPGTNCEYDTAKAFNNAGANSEIFVINNLTPGSVAQSVQVFADKVKNCQILFLPGGFSGGDEPDGSGKFISSFLRNPALRDAVAHLLQKNQGLIGGICNGFQALVNLGLLPFGEIVDTNSNCPILTYNDIGRHQSKIIRTRVCTTASPWLSMCEPTTIYSVPISHGEGKFVAPQKVLDNLVAKGQIATQYVDLFGNPSMDIKYNPAGSMLAIEGIISTDGKIFGKMGHTERTGKHLYKNVEGNYNMPIFRSAVEYFK